MGYNGSRTSQPPLPVAGFTLPELLVCLAILVLLLGIGGPGFQEMINISRSSTAIMNLHAMLSTARNEAVSRNTEVTVCGTGDGLTCNRDWQGQALVFIDRDHNRRLNAGDELLAEESLDSRGLLRWRGSGGRHYLRFRANGSAKEVGTFVWCPSNGDARHARAITVSFTGRPRAARDRSGDGLREDAGGDSLSCG